MALNTAIGAAAGLILGVAVSRKVRLTALGAGIGCGISYQNSNKYLQKLNYDDKHDKSLDVKLERDEFVVRLEDVKQKYFN
jgi:hypothetical protein